MSDQPSSGASGHVGAGTRGGSGKGHMGAGSKGGYRGSPATGLVGARIAEGTPASAMGDDTGVGSGTGGGSTDPGSSAGSGSSGGGTGGDGGGSAEEPNVRGGQGSGGVSLKAIERFRKESEGAEQEEGFNRFNAPAHPAKSHEPEWPPR